MARPVARKKLVWRVLWDTAETIITATAGNATSDVRDLVTQAELEDLDDEATIVRVVGDVHYVVTETVADVGPYQLFFGVMVREQSTTVGTDLSSVANVQDTAWSWLRTRALWGNGAGTVIGGANDSNGDFLTAHVDIRTKRKLGGGDRLSWVTTLSNAASTASANVRMVLNLRILVQA